MNKEKITIFLESNKTYDEYGDNPINARFNTISSSDSTQQLENITLKGMMLHGTFVNSLKIDNFYSINNSIASSIFNRVYIFDCFFRNSIIDNLNCKQSSSSGIPGNSFYKGLLVNKLTLYEATLINSEIRNIFCYKNDFSKVQIKKTYITATLFKKSHFYSINLKNCKLNSIVFKDCILSDIKFIQSKLENVSFIDCTISDCSFLLIKSPILKFENCTLSSIEWNDVELRKEFFINLRSSTSEFLSSYKSKEKKYIFYGYEELSELYLKLKNHFRDHGRYNDMSWAYLKEKESRRLQYLEELKKLNCPYSYLYFKEKKINRSKRVARRLKYSFLFIIDIFKYALFGYGEKPGFILGWSIFTILIFSFIYFFTSSLHSVYESNNPINYINSLYFSTITFTTVGFGDFIPAIMVSKISSMIESLLGLFFYSLFIFSFGRRFSGR